MASDRRDNLCKRKMSPNYTNKQSAYRIERVKNKPRPVPLSLSLLPRERERKKERKKDTERRGIGAKTQEENLQDSFIDNRGRFLVARL